jgi:hypothetical protein
MPTPPPTNMPPTNTPSTPPPASPPSTFKSSYPVPSTQPLPAPIRDDRMTMRPVQPSAYIQLIASPATTSEVKQPTQNLGWRVLKD